MAKKVILKEGGIIRVLGLGDFHDGNMTFAIYENLIKLNPNYKDQFTVTDQEEKEPEPLFVVPEKVKEETKKVKPVKDKDNG